MRFVLRIFVTVLLFAAPALRAQREKLSWEDREIVEKKWSEAKKTSTGLRYIILKEGTGDARPQPGDVATVLFQGRLLDGTVFNEALDRTRPFQSRIGRGLLIAGWEETLKHMRRGEKRLVIVPYELGYGTKGDPPRVPRRATLVFEIELLDFDKAEEPAGSGEG